MTVPKAMDVGETIRLPRCPLHESAALHGVGCMYASLLISKVPGREPWVDGLQARVHVTLLAGGTTVVWLPVVPVRTR